MLCICIDILNTKPIKRKTVKIQPSSPESIESFRNEVCHNIEKTYFDRNLLLDPHVSYTKLDQIIHDAKDKNLPEKIVKFNKYKHKMNPWITSGILQSIKYRDKLYKKLKCTNPESSSYNELNNRFKDFVRFCRKVKEQLK